MRPRRRAKECDRAECDRVDRAAVSQATQLKRRFNLLETTMLFIQVDQPGDYRFSTSGDGNADFLVEPLFPPPQYQRPGYLPSGRTWSLSEGYYRVTLEPTLEGKGIADLVIEGTVGGAERINPPRQFATRLHRSISTATAAICCGSTVARKSATA